MVSRLLSVAVLATFAGSAFAQTCGAPLPMMTDTDVAGDTCSAENTITGFGPLPSPHNDIVYSFVAQGANATLTVDAAGGYDYGLILVDACNPISPAPLNATTGPGNGGNFQLTGLTDGSTYYVVMTGNPNNANAQCGTYTIDVNGTVPVELQTFSVE